MNFVQLNRTFIDFRDRETNEVAIEQGTWARHSSGEISWAELIKTPCVVVLGEAGIGKTSELEEQAKTLAAQGNEAFFLDIGALASDGLPEALYGLDAQRLEAWKAGSTKAVFFLDSVDEARLRSSKDFERALKKLQQYLSEGQIRVCFVISCRVSDWHPLSDLRLIKRLLQREPSGSTIDSEKEPHQDSGQLSPQVRVVQMAPLSFEQLTALVKDMGVRDYESFLKDVTQHNAEAFVGRPRDVEWMAEYWQANHRLSRLTDLIEFNITKKLKEDNPERTTLDTLSSEKARLGAETLAAAVVLCKCPRLRLPDPEINSPKDEVSLDPATVLPGWTQKELTALLTRPLFDEASYGSVRFHLHSVAEYLTAKWLQRTKQAGCSTRQLLRILFRTAHGCKVAVPSLRRVTSWLAGIDRSVRQTAVSAAPEVVLLGGDPSQIPVEHRSNALRQVAEKYKLRKHMGWRLDDAELRRIADPALSPVINELLETHCTNVDVQELLFQLVRLGGLQNCSATALKVALSSSLDTNVRVYAAVALAEVATGNQLIALADYARSTPDLPNDLIGAFCRALFPKVLSVSDCLLLLEKAKREIPNRKTMLPYVLEHHIVETCPRKNLLDLLSGLHALVGRTPFAIKSHQRGLSARYLFVLDAIPPLFRRILASSLNPAWSALKAPFLLMQDIYEHKFTELYGLEGIREELKNHTQLRRDIFWDRVQSLGSQQHSNSRLWHAQVNLCPLAKKDIDWLVRDAGSMIEVEDRKVAAETAVRLSIFSSCLDDHKEKVLAAVQDHHGLSSFVSELISLSRNGPATGESFDEEQEKREREKALRLQLWKDKLTSGIEAIKTGQDYVNLYNLSVEMKQGKTASLRRGHDSWQALVQSFGEEIATAARDGFVVFWRSWKPVLPCQLENPNSVDLRVVVGLTGLAIEAGAGLDFTRLSPQEAEVAAHYALNEINGFPEWFPRLIEASSGIAQGILQTEFAAEFDFDSTDSFSYGTLSSLQQRLGPICDFAAPLVFDILKVSEPKRVGVLRESLRILVSAKALAGQFSSLAAASAIQHASAGDSERLLCWIVAWFRTAPNDAWRFTEEFILSQRLVALVTLKTGLEPNCWYLMAKSIDKFVLELANALKEPYLLLPAEPVSQGVSPNTLKNMILLLNFHIRPKEDIWHETGYSPGLRDNAQDYRNALPHQLAGIASDAAHQALLELADDDTLPESRELFLYLADQNLGLEAESEPWDAADPGAFAASFEREPATADDLFQITLDRLDDLRWEIESGDFSERGLFKPDMPEENIQKWVAARLDGASRGKYSVVREEEVDNYKKPDVRLFHQKAGRVGTEVKPTDRYSFSQLQRALKNQLVGQYLKDVNSRHGILLLANLKKRHWVPRDGSGRLSFPALVARLNSEAARLVDRDNGIDSVSVIGIDFVGSN